MKLAPPRGTSAYGIGAALGVSLGLAMVVDETLEQLMQRYIDGDIRAFDALYAKVAKRLFQYLLSMARDRARAEDLLQTTFLRVHRARSGWIPGSPVMPWVMAIGRNALYDDSLRAKRAKVRVTTTGELPDMVDLGEIDRALEREGPLASELSAVLAEALDALPPLLREAVVLTKQTGLSQREAAATLGTTETAVKLRVHRAYEALRAALRDYRARNQ